MNLHLTPKGRTLVLLSTLAATAGGLSAQVGTEQASRTGQGPDSPYPTHAVGRGLVTSALGIGAGVSGLLISPDVRRVPPSGLEASEIRWSVDRDIIGNVSSSAARASDWTRNAALLMPWVMAWAMGPGADGWHRMGARTLVYAETFFVSMGATTLGKSLISRPRPFAYLMASERPNEGRYDVTRDRAFFSMPSGHASSAWTATSLGMTEHLLYRPEAGGLERVAVGFLGGALGTSTAALRVSAGQHFPSDVIAGSLLGAGSGVIVPLLHRGSRPVPSGRAWLQTWGGAVAGSLLGVLIAAGY